MSKKVKYLNKKSCFIDKTAKFGKNVIIYPNNFIGKDVEIGDNVTLLSGNFIEGVKIENNCVIGPYSRIRPNTIIKKNSKIGNFVEVKNSVIGSNTKINHLSYVGDCEIGKNCNIGCGVIFVNYNGKIKQKIKIGNNAFVGSNSNLIAPLEIGDYSYICAGTNVTQNLDKLDFCIGRVKQTIKPNGAIKYLKYEQMFEKDV